MLGLGYMMRVDMEADVAVTVSQDGADAGYGFLAEMLRLLEAAVQSAHTNILTAAQTAPGHGGS